MGDNDQTTLPSQWTVTVRSSWFGLETLF